MYFICNILSLMKNFIPLLKSIGLWENGANVYVALLEIGTCTISELSQKSQLHRTQLYRVLPFLIESGFIIQSFEWKKKYYSPGNPEIIEQAYQDFQEKNAQNIEYLKNIYNNLEKKPTIRYEKWAKWITKVFSDIVSSTKKWDIFYRITSEVDTDFINKNYLPKDYREKRDKKELERYVIMSNKASKGKSRKLEREIKVIPEKMDEFEDNVFMTIYGKKVAFIDFNSESSIIIENQQIADFQKKLFKMLYKNLP